METQNLSHNLQSLIKQRNVFAFTVFTLVLANLLLIILLFSSKKSVILVPSVVNTEMGLSETAMSENYVQAFARDIIFTYSNITPSNIDTANSIILGYVPSNLYAEFKNELEEKAIETKKKGVSQHFYITKMEMQDAKSVIISGELNSQFLLVANLLKQKRRITV